MACNDRAVPKLPAEDETTTVADLRSITDENAEAQLRDASRWAYILRDPTGAICSYGQGKSRTECENQAALCAEEAWPENRM
jgi:hypothetical protein